MGPNKGPLGGHFGLRSTSRLRSVLSSCVNLTTQWRQPRDTVNIGSRSTCAVCVSHGTCLENRCRDLSMLCLLGTFLAIRFRMATKTPREDDFLRKTLFLTPNLGPENLQKGLPSWSPSSFFVNSTSLRNNWPKNGPRQSEHGPYMARFGSYMALFGSHFGPRPRPARIHLVSVRYTDGPLHE